ncbi:hypothetical protein MRF4_01170 [Methylobacterium radiotolerans]|uniref:Uncharacterized protein n=1 Tax=Methylobacterium oryzae TaxID=334852 RepID=A0ABU7TWF4_9HYPH
MADLIDFPGKRRGSVSAYRLRRFATDGSDRGTVLIRAHDDTEARQQADRLAEGLLAELWFGDRFLDHVAPADHPVAACVSAIGDGP